VSNVVAPLAPIPGIPGRVGVLVTDERQPFGDPRRGYAEALADDLRRVAGVLVRVVPPEPLVDELGVPLVGAGDDDVVSSVERGVGVGGDQVGLVVALDDAEAEAGEQAGQRALLHAQELGPGGTWVGVDHGHRARRRLERHDAGDGPCHGEQAVDGRAVAPPAVGGHDEVAAREEVRAGCDAGSVRTRAPSA
jgi:hypothetical protein